MAKRVQTTKKNALSHTQTEAKPAFDWESFAWLAIPAFLMLAVSSTSVMDITLIPKYLALTVFLFGGIVVSFFGKKENYLANILQNNAFLWAYLAFVLLSAISLFSASLFGDAFFSWSKMGLSLIFTLVLVNYYLKTDNLRENASLIIAIFTLISGLVGASQLVKLMGEADITHENLYEISSLFSHKNIFGEVMLLCLPFNLFGVFFSKSRITKYLSITAACFSLGFSIGLLSRSIWIALMLSALITFVLYAWLERKTEGQNIVKYLGIGLGVLSIGFVLLGFLISFETLLKQFNGIINIQHIANAERLEQWKNTLTLFSKQPLFGIGMENWKIEIMQFPAAKGTKSELGNYFFQRPHNDFLWVLCESGIFAFIAYVSLFVLAYANLYKTLKVTDNKEVRTWLYLLFSGLTAYCIFSNFSFPKERMEDIFLLNLIFVCILVEKIKAFPFLLRENEATIYPKILVITATLFLLGSFYIAYDRLDAERHLREYHKLTDLENLQKGEGAKNTMQLSAKEIKLAYRPLYQMDGVSTPLLYHIGTQYLKLNELDAGLKNLLAAQKLSPWHPQVLNNLGAAYSLSGNTKKTNECINKTLELAPKYEDALLTSVVTNAVAKDFDKAFERLMQVDTASVNPKYAFFNKAIRDSVAFHLAKKLEEPFLKSKVYSIVHDKNWAKAVLMKAKKQNISFSEMLEAEALEMMKKDKNLSDAEWVMLRDKYFPKKK
jgi:O-antigen ligase/tetratricopeptide (TPR) repeat protein